MEQLFKIVGLRVTNITSLDTALIKFKNAISTNTEFAEVATTKVARLESEVQFQKFRHTIQNMHAAQSTVQATKSYCKSFFKTFDQTALDVLNQFMIDTQGVDKANITSNRLDDLLISGEVQPEKEANKPRVGAKRRTPNTPINSRGQNYRGSEQKQKKTNKQIQKP